jgi:hypothetical protein
MAHNELNLITGDELAKLHGYKSLTSQCRAWWKSIGIVPCPGRRNIYDPKLVRDRMDFAVGRTPAPARDAVSTLSLTEQRRARKNAQG